MPGMKRLLLRLLPLFSLLMLQYGMPGKAENWISIIAIGSTGG